MKNLLTPLFLLMLLFTSPLAAQEGEAVQGRMDNKAAEKIGELEEPLYNPFVERYVLDELKLLRQEMAEQRATMIKTVTDRELSVADRSMTYAVDTITYFFYVIAAVSALLVILGWNSMREVKDKVEQLAQQEVARISETFEERLKRIEDELHQKSENIRSTQHQLSITNEIHSLWLKATQETQPGRAFVRQAGDVHALQILDELQRCRGEVLAAPVHRIPVAPDRQSLHIQQHQPFCLQLQFETEGGEHGDANTGHHRLLDRLAAAQFQVGLDLQLLVRQQPLEGHADP